jgi:hypothetical protein
MSEAGVLRNPEDGGDILHRNVGFLPPGAAACRVGPCARMCARAVFRTLAVVASEGSVAVMPAFLLVELVPCSVQFS